MSQPLDIIIVERLGSLKILSIKDYKQEDLYKKCGFKKAEDFNKQTEWSVKISGTKYIIQLYAKMDGRANSENKYDFPPPVDVKLFYGSCALVGYIKNGDGTKVLTNLTLGIWNKIYEKLFGGFEDLVATAKEDEEEEDELENIPKEKKTKNGYLKDGFVVDSSDTEENSEPDSESDDIDDDEDETEEDSEKVADEDDIEIQDVGSELSEESYDYDDNNVGK
jgi:hypothetical protein